MIVGNNPRSLGTKMKFSRTDKDLENWQNEREYVVWWMADEVGREFPEGATMSEIYHKITGPKNLNKSDTAYLVKRAIEMGYLKRGR